VKLSLGTIHYQGEDNETVVVEPIKNKDAPFDDDVPF